MPTIQHLLNVSKHAFLVAVIGLALTLSAQQAEAAISAQDKTTLTANLQTLANSADWGDGSISNSAATIMQNPTYTVADWQQFFTGYFANNNVTRPLNRFLDYALNVWSDNATRAKLQNGILPGLTSSLGNMVAAHAADFGPFIKANEAARTHVALSHSNINAIINGTKINDASRNAVAQFYTSQFQNYPSLFKGQASFDLATSPNLPTLRAFWQINLIQSLPFTAARKATLASTFDLSGRNLDLWNNYGVLIADNNGLDDAQWTTIDTLLSKISASLHNLRMITVIEMNGNAAYSLQVSGYNVINIFGNRVGSYAENPFPSDVAAYSADLFASVLMHEVNHIVSGYGYNGKSAYVSREKSLIAQAGPTYKLNYLRSNVLDATTSDFFVSNPQEFFASISNQYFAHSGKTLELAMARWNTGYQQPINQFLFFAEVFSEQAARAPFFTLDALGYFTTTMVPVTRDANGFINQIAVGDKLYQFTLDANGNVLTATDVVPCHDYSATNSAHTAAGRAYTKKATSWWTTTTTYYATGSNESLGTSATATVALKEATTGHFAKGTCPLAAFAPTIETVGQPTVKKVSETADQITFEVAISGTAADINGNLTRVQIGYSIAGYTCEGTTNFNCKMPFTLNKADLPLTLQWIGLLAEDATGLTSEFAYFDADFADVACQDFTATASAHVTAGRAYTKVVKSFYTNTTTYYAVGSNQNLGTSATAVITLKNEPAGNFAKGSCPLPPVMPVVNATSVKTTVNGKIITVTGTASDANNDISKVSLVMGFSGTPCTGTTNFTCTVTAPDYGTYRLALIATDSTNLNSDSVVFDVEVKAQTSTCVSATAANHVKDGRATLKYNVLYYANGSNDLMGSSATAVVFLNQTAPGTWKKVNSCN